MSFVAFVLWSLVTASALQSRENKINEKKKNQNKQNENGTETGVASDVADIAARRAKIDRVAELLATTITVMNRIYQMTVISGEFDIQFD